MPPNPSPLPGPLKFGDAGQIKIVNREEAIEAIGALAYEWMLAAGRDKWLAFDVAVAVREAVRKQANAQERRTMMAEKFDAGEARRLLAEATRRGADGFDPYVDLEDLLSAMRVLLAAYEATRWREWPEEIPETHGRYLAIEQHNRPYTDRWDGAWCNGEPTHWMPLPAPPEGL